LESEVEAFIREHFKAKMKAILCLGTLTLKDNLTYVIFNYEEAKNVCSYNALKILGKTVELVTVDGENHHIVAREKKLAWNRTIYAWFACWLKEESEWW
jgi:hypothetical protein